MRKDGCVKKRGGARCGADASGTRSAPRAGNPIRSKKGSTAVFLVMILSSLLLLASVLIGAAGLAAGKSYGDLVFRMAGRSLLSEYDRKLYADYGLFAMRSDEEQAARKLTHYSDASLKDGGRAGAVWLLPCKTKDLRVYLSDFSLLDTEIFEKQVLDDIKFIMVNNLANGLRAAPADGTGNGTAEPRTINNQTVLNGLPSKGMGGGGPSPLSMLAAGLPSAGELLNGGTDAFFVSEYIMARFAHAYAPVPNLAAGHTRFFQYETEYILVGGHSDKDNLKGVESKLRVLRFALNEVCIHNDKELTASVNALASSLSAVFKAIPAAVFRELIYAVWVALETDNDLKLLRAGKNVALVKAHDNWAVSIDAVPRIVIAYLTSASDSNNGSSDINTTSENAARYVEMAEPRDKSGFSYGDYLRLFLFFTSRENKLLRSMDLIQINMKTGYYEAFLLREHYVGLRYELTMNGDRYRYRQSYDAVEQ
jgi:hypothetical protein